MQTNNNAFVCWNEMEKLKLQIMHEESKANSVILINKVADREEEEEQIAFPLRHFQPEKPSPIPKQGASRYDNASSTLLFNKSQNFQFCIQQISIRHKIQFH